MRQWWSILCVVILACLTSSSAIAQRQEVEVRATLGASVAYLGDELQLVVDVDNGVADRAPTVPSTASCEVRYTTMRDRSFSITIGVGSRRRQETQAGQSYFYAVTPLGAGQVTIDPIEVFVDGKRYVTNPVSLRVVEPTKNLTDLKVMLDVDNESPYAGEPVTMTLSIAIAPMITLSDVNLRLIGEEQFDIARKSSAPVARTEPEFLGAPAGFQSRRDVIDGAVFEVFTLQRTVTPKAAGEITLGPAVLIANVSTRGTRRQERAALQSNTPVLHVREVPSEGKPAGYSGLVGAYAIDARADVRDVSVGDPVPLVVAIAGPEPISRVRAPDLMSDPAFSDGFRMASDDVEADREQGVVTFTYSIRVAKEGVSEIPPVRLAYFDSAAGQYVVKQTDPIPLTVRATRIVTAGDAQGTSGAVAPGRELESMEGGMRHNEVGAALLRDERTDLGAMVRSPVVIATGAAPLGACVLALCGTVVRKRSGGAAAVRRAAWSQAKALLEQARRGEDAADACARAVEGCVAAACLGRAGSVTAVEAERLVAVRDAALAQRVRTLLERCDAARFGAGSADTSAMVDEAQAIVDALARLPKAVGVAA
ncbi:MAG: BatD family protein [Phycisphaerales bacterium]|nr:BatD family protein [Phycisphaerales bacterium]